MVFQMVPLIFKFFRMVILRVVSRAVNHMSDLIGLQSLLVLGNQVWTQENEAIHYFSADSFESVIPRLGHRGLTLRQFLHTLHFLLFLRRVFRLVYLRGSQVEDVHFEFWPCSVWPFRFLGFFFRRLLTCRFQRRHGNGRDFHLCDFRLGNSQGRHSLSWFHFSLRVLPIVFLHKVFPIRWPARVFLNLV